MLDLAEYFKTDYHVILPDFPGHYGNPTQAVDNFDLFVAIYKTFIETLVRNSVIKEKPYMMGWSLGGSLTLALASQNVLEKAVLLNGDSKWTECDLPRYTDDTMLREGFKLSFNSPSEGADPKMVEHMIATIPECVTDYQTANKDLDMDFSLDIRENLKNIKIPVILIFGDHDFLTTLKKQEELVNAIDGSILIPIVGGTHQVCADRPDKVAEEILKVL